MFRRLAATVLLFITCIMIGCDSSGSGSSPLEAEEEPDVDETPGEADDATCAPIDLVLSGTTQENEGQLEASDCGDETLYVDYYPFETASTTGETRVQFEAQSGELSPVVTLLNEQDEVLSDTTASCLSGGAGSNCVTSMLPDGAYTLGVSSDQQPEEGSYTLLYQAEEVEEEAAPDPDATCSPVDIQPSEVTEGLSGALAATDCGDDAFYVDYYPFEVSTPNGRATIFAEVTSTDVEPTLAILNEEGDPVEEDVSSDCFLSDGARPGCVTAALPDGTYAFAVSSTNQPEEGTYELQFSAQPVEPDPEPDPEPDCDPSYPDVCIPPPPPVLECGDIEFTDFTVVGEDPHGFDPDGNGVGCESDVPPPSPDPPQTCDSSYPDVCIPPPPPDLDCSDIEERDFTVVGEDPHDFDPDGDGIGCESDTSSKTNTTGRMGTRVEQRAGEFYPTTGRADARDAERVYLQERVRLMYGVLPRYVNGPVGN